MTVWLFLRLGGRGGRFCWKMTYNMHKTLFMDAPLGLVQGLVESPVKLVVLCWFYLTSVLPSPWETETVLCDSMHNCVSLGVVLSLFTFSYSFCSLCISSLDARQTDDNYVKIDFMAFILPVVAFKMSSIILALSLGQEWSAIPLVLHGCVNLGMLSKYN